MARLPRYLFLPLLFLASGLAAQESKCLKCHSLSTQVTEETGPPIDTTLIRASAHAGLECQDCHVIDGTSRHAGMTTVYCPRCHLSEADSFAESPHQRALEEDVERLPTCPDCHGGHDILPVTNERSRTNHRNSVAICIRCHEDESLTTSHEGMPAPALIKAYEHSVHGRALLVEGKLEAPACVDCHGSHTTYPADRPESPVYRTHIAQTCGQCHADIAVHYRQSVHGTALDKGVTESPTCTDCHGEHSIQRPEDPESSVYPTNVSTTCADCHASPKLVGKYGLQADRIGTFKESFHGAAAALGDTRVANCASCHGVHDIYPQDDPRSPIHASRIAQTCGRCHEDLPASFAEGEVHTSPADVGSGGEYYVRRFYYWFISILIIGFVLYRVLEHRRRRDSGGGG